MSETRIRRANTKSDTPKRFILRSWYSFFLFFFFIFSCILSSRLVLWNSACIPCLLTRHILTYWQCLPKRVNLIKRHVKWTYAKWAKEIWRWKRDRKKERQRKSWMNECRTEPLKLRSNSYLNEQMELCVVFFFFLFLLLWYLSSSAVYVFFFDWLRSASGKMGGNPFGCASSYFDELLPPLLILTHASFIHKGASKCTADLKCRSSVLTPFGMILSEFSLSDRQGTTHGRTVTDLFDCSVHITRNNTIIHTIVTQWKMNMNIWWNHWT